MFTYRIQEGDSPMLIAERFTGDPSRYKELLAANLWKIRVIRNGQPTFFNMRVGELLRVPPAWRTLPNAMAFPTGLGDSGSQCTTDSDCTDPNNPSCYDGVCGPTFNCSGAADPQDSSIINSATACGASFAQNEENQITAGSIWANGLKGAAVGAEAVIAATGAVALITGILSTIGATTVSDIIAALFAEILDAIAAICFNVTATIAAALGGGTAIGGAIGAAPGAIIGLVVGIIVGIMEVVFHTCSIQVTNGTVVNCTDYGKNLQNLASWLQANQGNLASTSATKVTAKFLADKFSVFLANPIWLYANQSLLGITQPQPPVDPNDERTPIYIAPGAYEMLNKAQLAAASQLVTSCPGKIPVWMMIPIPGTPVPSQNLQDYSPLGGADPNASTMISWAPGEIGQSSASLPTVTYTACPDLMIGTSNQTPFNTASPGTYVLQQMFQTLSNSQCENIFNHNNTQMVYAQNIAAAKAWALSQCDDPTNGIGTGSKFNLEAQDVEPIVALWKETMQPTCQVQAAQTAAKEETAATTIAVAGAVAASGVWWFAAKNRMTFGQAAKTLLRKGTGAAAKLIK
jgi:hypothetical protein